MIRLFQFPLLKLVAIAVAACCLKSSATASAAVIPFTETFASNTSGWLNAGSAPATYVATGGVDNDGYISTTRAFPLTGGFGPIIFRGNATASNGNFAGNWLTAGVTELRMHVRHDAPEAMNFYMRFDRGGGAAASTNSFSIASNTWTEVVVPIIDSNAVFQSYGSAGTQSDPFGFVFSNIISVQLALSLTQPTSFNTNTYTIGLDSVSAVPEPSSIGLCAIAAGCSIWYRRRRAKLMPAEEVS